MRNKRPAWNTNSFPQIYGHTDLRSNSDYPKRGGLDRKSSGCGPSKSPIRFHFSPNDYLQVYVFGRLTTYRYTFLHQLQPKCLLASRHFESRASSSKTPSLNRQGKLVRGGSEVEVLCCQPTGVVSDQGKPHLVVANVDIRVVSGLLSNFANLVHEGQRSAEVLEKKRVYQFTGFDLPVGYGGQSGFDFRIGKWGHSTTPSESAPAFSAGT